MAISLSGTPEHHNTSAALQSTLGVTWSSLAPSAGDLIVVFVALSRDTNTNRVPSISGYSTAVAGSWAWRVNGAVFYKVSDGTETGFTVTLNTGDAYITATTYVFTGFSAAALDSGVEAVVNNGSSNVSETVTAGTGTTESEELIFIAQSHYSNQINPYDTAPTGYTMRYDGDGSKTANIQGYKITSTTETPSYYADWGTSFSSTRHNFMLVAFKGAGGGGGTIHDLTVDELTHAVALDAAAVTRIVGLNPAGLSQAVTLGAATVTRIVGLAADALAQGTALNAATVTRLVGLTVDELTQAVALDAAAVARAIGLTVDPIGQAATFDAAAVTRILGLLPDPMGQSLTLAAASLGVVYSLGVQAMAQAATLDDPSLGLLVSIAVDSLLSSTALDSVSINKAIQLTVDALAQATALDAADVTRIRSLVVASLLQAQALDTVTLSRVVQLTVADMLQAAALDSAAVGRILGLTVNDLLLSVYLDSVVLADAAPPKYIELDGVKVDLIELLAQKIDSISLTGVQ